jgi:hypothetical protein
MLATPRATFAARDVFEDICAGIADAERKKRLKPNAPKVEAAAHDYEVAGAAGTIDTITAATYEPYGTATTQDFTWLYDQRLVNSSSGRVYYRSLRDSNGGRCALCNVRQASTLDHHLPKARHPIFAVTPDNLLPACKDCNTTKLASLTATLNTYFDDLGSGSWLAARVIESTPATVDFGLVPQPMWSPDLAARANAHFELFALGQLYSFQADRHIAGVRKLLGDLATSVGPTGVRNHLTDEAESWADGEPNSWESAMYAALAASDWFCDGGHALV